jgi:acyl-CoA synthetase (NDP forming)
MINNQLINPESILVVGASNNVQKPGGKVLKNILDGNFDGKIFGLNPKETEVQGIPCFKSPDEIPVNIDLAILSIPSRFITMTVKALAETKNTKAFIVLSAGFKETGEKGAALEKELVEEIKKVNGTLIGPNCMGVLTTNYQGTFAGPIPKLHKDGVEFISGSGATAAFIMEAGIEMGLTFSSMFSVGNSAFVGVEDIVKYLDETYEDGVSSKVKLLYFENIENPLLLLKHASSLIRKGCKIAAIKAGASEAGSRAASSHTGALASSDEAVDTLFKKAGIVRCYGRQDLILTGAIFSQKELKGKNIAIITHAGGPGVMLSDSLSKGGLNVPQIEGEVAKELLTKLYPGSSVSNPIDFLATGTAEQLEIIIDSVNEKMDDIDGMVVIFGTPGLFDVTPVYRLIDQKMKDSKKPIYPVLPSIVVAKEAVETFKSLGRINFSDEVLFGEALSKLYNWPEPVEQTIQLPQVDKQIIRSVIDNNRSGYLSPENVTKLLDGAGIKRVSEFVTDNLDKAVKFTRETGYPVVMKVVGPLHKSDSGGVILNVNNAKEVEFNFNKLMDISDSTSVLIQPMISGKELFIGAKKEEKFGHLILFGMGGIYIEIFKDVVSVLHPVSEKEVLSLIENLKSYKVFEGVRGQKGISREKFASIISKLSSLLEVAPEIEEMDINPLLAYGETIIAVDARIRISK